MIKTVLATAFAAFLAGGAAAQTPARPSTPEQWRAAATADLKAIRDELRANHPAPHVDKDSAPFRAWIDEGYRRAQTDLAKVADSRSYYYLLRGYVAGFRDGHVAFNPTSAGQIDLKTLRWPGFATSWRGGRYVVSYVLPAAAVEAPPLGAALVSCDGKGAEKIARERLDRYESNLDLESGRFYSAGRLLWDRGNLFVPNLPAVCVFDAGGETKTYSLKYREAVQDEVRPAADAATGLVRAEFGIRAWGDARRWWIGVPTSEDSLDWKSFFAELGVLLPSLREAEVVVIDVRGNGGGSSVYGERLAQQLWGEPLVAARKPRLGRVVHRVSPANRAFFAGLLSRYSDDPAYQPYLSRWREIVAGLDAGARRGEPLFVGPRDDAARPPEPAESPMKGRMVLLTDYACSSACLDLMDLFMVMPKVEHAGVTTHADTIFMELTELPLPSRMAELGTPHKAWVERPRGSNVAYTPKPALTYRGSLRDDAAVRAWLETAVANGAEARR